MALERKSGGSAGGTVGAATVLFSRFQLAEQRSMATRISQSLIYRRPTVWILEAFSKHRTDNGHVGINVLKRGEMSGWWWFSENTVDGTTLHPSYPSDAPTRPPLPFGVGKEAPPLVSRVNLICMTPANEISSPMAPPASLCVRDAHCAEFAQNVGALLRRLNFLSRNFFSCESSCSCGV